MLAGSSIRPVLELAGIQNVLAKRLGCRSLLNNARVAVKALEQLRTLQVGRTGADWGGLQVGRTGCVAVRGVGGTGCVAVRGVRRWGEGGGRSAAGTARRSRAGRVRHVLCG